MSIFYSVHATASNDPNGNPRRMYLVFREGGELYGVADEGYKGSRAISSQLYRDGRPVDMPEGSTVIELCSIPTTAAFRRDTLREALPRR